MAPPGVHTSSSEPHRPSFSISSSQEPPSRERRQRRSGRAVPREHDQIRMRRWIESGRGKRSGLRGPRTDEDEPSDLRPPGMACSQTAGVSNTVCIGTSGQGSAVWAKVEQDEKQLAYPAACDMVDLGGGHGTAPTAATAREHADPGRGKQQGQSVSQQAVSAKRTTVVMCNVPPSYTQEDLAVLLDSHGFAEKVDFLYMPINITTMLGTGRAFLNLTSCKYAKEFARVFEGFTDWGSAESRVCHVRWSEVQGLEANVQRLQNSPVMGDSVLDACKPLLFEDGLSIPFREHVQTSHIEIKRV